MTDKYHKKTFMDQYAEAMGLGDFERAAEFLKLADFIAAEARLVKREQDTLHPANRVEHVEHPVVQQELGVIDSRSLFKS